MRTGPRTRHLSACFLIVSACLAFGSEAYFSPGGGIQNQIIRRVNLARSTIDIAMYSFTSEALAEALADAHERGVKIRVIRDASQSHNKHDENAFLRAHGIDIRVMKGKARGIFHDKFAIFDDKLLETGSFNWTANGEKYNHENVIFFTDPELIRAFRQEFEKLWKAAARVTPPAQIN